MIGHTTRQMTGFQPHPGSPRLFHTKAHPPIRPKKWPSRVTISAMSVKPLHIPQRPTASSRFFRRKGTDWMTDPGNLTKIQEAREGVSQEKPHPLPFLKSVSGLDNRYHRSMRPARSQDGEAVRPVQKPFGPPAPLSPSQTKGNPLHQKGIALPCPGTHLCKGRDYRRGKGWACPDRRSRANTTNPSPAAR